MSTLRLPTSLCVIFGSFTLGFYVAIQGPTLMDLIDLLHVNNDIMSYSLAFASLAYSLGGLLSGFLFNYVNRQILIAIYFLIFGISNIITPYISNFLIFTCITVFKMMCAGGTDCGANVWILEMWPGQDQWLQALHFTFAVGCALGPLVVEPFLSVETKENEIDKIAGKLSGTTTISDQNNESRIHIPYAVSGSTSVFAAIFILYLYYLEDKRKKTEMKKLRAKQQAASGEHILLTAIQHPATLEAASTSIVAGDEATDQVSICMKRAVTPSSLGRPESGSGAELSPKSADSNALTESAQFTTNEPEPVHEGSPEVEVEGEGEPEAEAEAEAQKLMAAVKTESPAPQVNAKDSTSVSLAPDALVNCAPAPAPAPTPSPLPVTGNSTAPPQKITSKAREQLVGRPPYYVMFAIALAALCLSFYCGIEITSMNYLATFAVNIDLQLPKSTAALMSSALTISFAVGRGFGIWIAAFMRPHKLFYLCAGIMASGNVLMLIFANTAEKLLWCSICLFGMGCGPMFPAIVSFYDDRISKVTNTVSGIFILGSMFNVALNSLIIGHHIIDNALILIVCNLVGSVLLLFLFGTLHMLTKVKKQQRVRKYKLQQEKSSGAQTTTTTTTTTTTSC